MKRRAMLSALGAGLSAGACAARAPAKPPTSVAPTPRRAAAPGGPVLRARELLADAALLRRAYEALHPGLYRYNTPAQLGAHYAALERALGRDQSLQEAFIALTTFTATLKCGHSYPNFFNQPDEVAAAILNGQPCLPFFFRWLGGRMVVTRSFAPDGRLAPGAEVLAIDGVPARAVLEALLPLARADGSNDEKRVNYLEARGESTYDAFDVYYAMLFPPRGGHVELDLADPRSGARATSRVPTLRHADRVDAIEGRERGRAGGAPAWRVAFFDDKLAVLTMPTWALYRTTWDWRAFLDETFAEIARRGVTDLAIDLRGNEGGLGVGDVLLGHLSARPVAPDPYRRLVRYRKVPADLDPHLDTWDDSFRDWGEQAVEVGGGFYRLTRRDGEGPRGDAGARPPRPPFGGRTWVLVDASNSSATFEFALAVRQNRLGTLVGRTTGGNLRGINGGAFFFLRLPNSKIEVDVPLIGQFPEGERPDAGLVPDLIVTPTAADIAAGVDVELATLRARRRAG
ncbi:MAG TPA: S41 family peptidase [Polyangiaceae bacterium]|nr:S41 family peptidase [Polyangiaceae bacterium]